MTTGTQLADGGAVLGAEGRPARNPLRRVVIALVILFIAGGVIYLSGLTEVFAVEPSVTAECSTTRPIPPFRVIVADDLYCGPVGDGATAASSSAARALLENRYALAPLGADQPIATADVGPRLPDDFRSFSVISVAGGSSLSLDGRLYRGARVAVYWANQEDAEDLVPLDDNLVLDIRARGEDQWVVTLATRTPVDPLLADRLSSGQAVAVLRAS
jgi:hypothetical protein